MDDFPGPEWTFLELDGPFPGATWVISREAFTIPGAYMDHPFGAFNKLTITREI